MDYLLLAVVSFFQSAIFTLNSRSRASGDVYKHFFTANLSHGVWFVTTFMLILPKMSEAFERDSYVQAVSVCLLYMISNSLGGFVMMKINLGHWYVPWLTEKGKSKVGAR